MKHYLYLLLLLPVALLAQPGALDLSFNPGAGVWGGVGVVNAMVYQPNTDVVIAGAFSHYDTTVVSNIARCHSNGKVDTAFNTGSGFDQMVYALALQADGKILVGGDFWNYNNTPANYIVRLNSNGTLDTSFNTGTGFNNRVWSITVQPDGKILVGGVFTSYNNSSYNRLIRLLPNGAVDTSFHQLSGADGSVETITLQPDGKILIGGDFINYDGMLNFRVTRLLPGGEWDSSFHAIGHPSAIGADAVVHKIEVTPLGKIIVGGYFNSIQFQTKRKIAQLLPEGSFDGNFNFQNQGCNTNSEVWGLKLLGNGQIMAGGTFNSYNTDTINRIARLNSNGSLDTVFDPGSGPNDVVFQIAVGVDGKIYIAGAFNEYNNIIRNRIARLYNCLTEKPDSIYGNPNALCSGTAQTYTLTPVSGATKYEWTLPNGWQGSSDSTSVTAISNGSGGTITVKAFTDSCGWSYLTSRTISTIAPPGVDVCLVTVDSASTHNIIIWEKPQTTLIDSFIIYRETTTGQYTKIAAVAYHALSEYHDTAANPNATSYRYKISVLDTCGAESALSEYHNTIHLQYLGNGNFQWTFYQIENQANPVTSFNLYRDALNNGSYFPIGNIPGTNATFTDLTWSSFPDANYVVDVNWNKSCTPSRAVSTTRSNIRRGGNIINGIINESDENSFRIYPNPAKSSFTVAVPENLTGRQLTVTDLTGKVMIQVQLETVNPKLETTGWAAGIYYVKLGEVVKRLVVE